MVDGVGARDNVQSTYELRTSSFTFLIPSPSLLLAQNVLLLLRLPSLSTHLLGCWYALQLLLT